jgi:hypothetical protein
MGRLVSVTRRIGWESRPATLVVGGCRQRASLVACSFYVSFFRRAERIRPGVGVWQPDGGLEVCASTGDHRRLCERIDRIGQALRLTDGLLQFSVNNWNRREHVVAIALPVHASCPLST